MIVHTELVSPPLSFHSLKAATPELVAPWGEWLRCN